MGKLMKLNGTREENTKKKSVDDKSCRLIFFTISGFRSPFWHNRRRNRLIRSTIFCHLAARNSIFEPSNFFFFFFLSFLFLTIANKGDEETTLSLVYYYYYASGLCVPRERLRFSFTIINTIYRLLIMIIDIINYAWLAKFSTLYSTFQLTRSRVFRDSSQKPNLLRRNIFRLSCFTKTLIRIYFISSFYLPSIRAFYSEE